jgi:hypothetical protein
MPHVVQNGIISIAIIEPRTHKRSVGAVNSNTWRGGNRGRGRSCGRQGNCGGNDSNGISTWRVVHVISFLHVPFF